MNNIFKIDTDFSRGVNTENQVNGFKVMMAEEIKRNDFQSIFERAVAESISPSPPPSRSIPYVFSSRGRKVEANSKTKKY